MSDQMKTPKIGSLAVDCTDCADFMVDLDHGAMQGMRTEQQGFSDASAQVIANQAMLGQRAGISNAEIESLQTLSARIALLDKKRPALHKLVEMVDETRAALVNERERLLYAIAQAVEVKAKIKGNEDLLARYEVVRNYRSAAAYKAAKTRKKNQQAKKAAAAVQAVSRTPASE